jgi:hypothetical protein
MGTSNQEKVGSYNTTLVARQIIIKVLVVSKDLFGIVTGYSLVPELWIQMREDTPCEVSLIQGIHYSITCCG